MEYSQYLINWALSKWFFRKQQFVVVLKINTTRLHTLYGPIQNNDPIKAVTDF